LDQSVCYTPRRAVLPIYTPCLYLLQLVAIHSLSEMMRFGARSCVRSEHRATSVCELASKRQWQSCADETGTSVNYVRCWTPPLVWTERTESTVYVLPQIS